MVNDSAMLEVTDKDNDAEIVEGLEVMEVDQPGPETIITEIKTEKTAEIAAPVIELSMQDNDEEIDILGTSDNEAEVIPPLPMPIVNGQLNGTQKHNISGLLFCKNIYPSTFF